MSDQRGWHVFLTCLMKHVDNHLPGSMEETVFKSFQHVILHFRAWRNTTISHGDVQATNCVAAISKVGTVNAGVNYNRSN